MTRSFNLAIPADTRRAKRARRNAWLIGAAATLIGLYALGDCVTPADQAPRPLAANGCPQGFDYCANMNDRAAYRAWRDYWIRENAKGVN